MIFDPIELLSLGIGYLFLLFLVAHLSESGLIPTKWIRNGKYSAKGLTLDIYLPGEHFSIK